MRGETAQAAWQGECVLIVDLLLNDVALEKLARRGIDQQEVDQLRANGPLVARNPHPRVRGSRFLVGPTDGGRLLTLVVDPHASDEGAWFVQTGWDAGKRERKLYYQRGRS
jgi:hypothetical protein